MSKGRKPKPTAMHKRDGTFRPDKHGPEDHPLDSIGGEPEKPPGLPHDGEMMWDHMVTLLCPLGVITELDGYQLEVLCLQWAKYRELAYRAIEENYDDEDCAKLEKRANAAYVVFDKAAMQFGLSPIARAKLRTVPNDAPEKDVYAEFGIVGATG